MGEPTHPADNSGRVDLGGNGGLMGQVKERAGAQLMIQKDRATDGLGTIARAVRSTTQGLRDDSHNTMAEYVERTADQLERLSTRLKNTDAGELFRDAQSFARRQPLVFVGSAFALGLLSARFFKSTPSTESRDQPAWQRIPTGGNSAGPFTQSGPYGGGATEGRAPRGEFSSSNSPSMTRGAGAGSENP
jgi:hypothetical protein